MSTSYPREKRRRLLDLQKQVDLAVHADDLFFRRHTDRNHRLRLTSRAEVAILGEIHRLGEVRLPAGERWYTIVKQIDAVTGTRTRLFTGNTDGLDTDLSEAECAWIYDRIAGGNTNVARAESAIRSVLESGWGGR